MGDPSDMPKLAKEDPAFLVHRIDDWLPRFNVLFSPNARGISVALCRVRHSGGLYYQEATFGRSLRVV